MSGKDHLDDQATMVTGTSASTQTGRAVSLDDAPTAYAGAAPLETDSADPDGRFQIIGELGKGGMGVVYKARDRKLGRVVALKCLRPETQENQKTLERFWNEAKAIASLNHFNIIQLYNVLDKGSDLWIEMEFVPGGSLKDKVVKGGPLPVEEIIEVGIQISDALAHAHEKGICHRDVKPGNILMTERGTPKLGDFGLAREAGQSQENTVRGALVGTMFFAAPEQMAGGGNIDGRSDIYSLGATLYAAATGEAPRAIRLDRVPERVREVIGRCLEERPDRRYQDAADLKKALENLRAPTHTTGRACTQCGHTNPLSVRYCQKCGNALAGRMEKCSKCGQENLADAEFCGRCGMSLHSLRLCQAAQRAFSEGRIAESRSLWEQALAKDPGSEQASLGLKRAVRVLEDIAAAREKAAKAAERGDKEGIHSAFKQVLQHCPNDPEALAGIATVKDELLQTRMRRARSFFSLKRYDKALEQLQEALEIEEHDEKALILLSQLTRVYKPAASVSRDTTPPTVSMQLSVGRGLNKSVIRVIAIGLVLAFLGILFYLSSGASSSPQDDLAEESLMAARKVASLIRTEHPGRLITAKSLADRGFVAKRGVTVRVLDPNPKSPSMEAFHPQGNLIFRLEPSGIITTREKEEK
ncbi:MAG: protein kinase [Thermodesulfobacteriota bacterium]